METYSNSDFSGGMNVKRPQYHIADNELVQMINCTFDTPGLIKSRLGCSKFNEDTITGATKVTWCYRFYDKDGTTKATLVAVNGASSDKLYVDSDDTGEFTEVTGGSVLTKGSYYSGVAWRDTLFISNGVEAIQLWTTSTTRADITGDPAPPIGKYLEVHTERLWIAGNSTNPSRVYYSEVGDETDFPANNYMDIKEDDGGIIMGIAELGQTIMVFKSTGVYKIYGSGTDTFEVISVGGMPGLIAPRSLVKALGGVIWLSKDGVFFYDGETMTDISSEKIEPITDAILGANLQKVSACYADEKYYLMYPDGETYNNKILVYDFHSQGWYVFTEWNLACMMWWNGQDDEGEIYGGDSNGGYVYKLLTGYTDVAEAILVTIETKHIDGNAIHNVKHWKSIHIAGLSTDEDEAITVTPILDLSSSPDPTLLQDISVPPSALWDTAYWDIDFWDGTGLRRARLRLPNSAKSRMLGLKMEWSGTTGELQIRGFEINYDVLSGRR